MLKILLTFIMVFSLTGCTCSTTKPKDPHWDRETCAHCRMAVSEPRFAALNIGPGTRMRYYDDIGCALRHRHDEPELAKGDLYVRPYPGNAWVKAAEAQFATGLITPMGYGFGAVASGGEVSLAEVEAAVMKTSGSTP